MYFAKINSIIYLYSYKFTNEGGGIAIAVYKSPKAEAQAFSAEDVNADSLGGDNGAQPLVDPM